MQISHFIRFVIIGLVTSTFTTAFTPAVHAADTNFGEIGFIYTFPLKASELPKDEKEYLEMVELGAHELKQRLPEMPPAMVVTEWNWSVLVKDTNGKVLGQAKSLDSLLSLIKKHSPDVVHLVVEGRSTFVSHQLRYYSSFAMEHMVLFLYADDVSAKNSEEHLIKTWELAPSLKIETDKKGKTYVELDPHIIADVTNELGLLNASRAKVILAGKDGKNKSWRTEIDFEDVNQFLKLFTMRTSEPQCELLLLSNQPMAKTAIRF